MKILLATGRKAEEMVKDAIADLSDIDCTVLTQDLNIAAFSTPGSLKKALGTYSRDCDLILVPGLCKSEFSGLEEQIATPIRLGPRNAYDLAEALKYVGKLEFSSRLPADVFLTAQRYENAHKELYKLESSVKETFKLKDVKIGGEVRMKVCAELVDATMMHERDLHRKIDYYMKCGADILDIGIHIGAKPAEVKRAVKTTRSYVPDIPVSVDTLDAELILAGIESGADMVLSVNRANIAAVADAIAGNEIATVVIPDSDSSIESLYANINRAREEGIKRIIADPVLNAIGYGLAESLYNYYLFRLRDKNTPLFFGIGNITELIDADSPGVNATLAGIASDLNADILFTPEYSDKARGCVRELRVASELMMLAKIRKSAPKDVGLNLLILKEKRRRPVIKAGNEGLIAASSDGKWQLDPKGSFRIGIIEVEDDKRLYAEHLPTGKRIAGRTAKAMMETIIRLGLVTLLEHVSYLSRELTKAELALRLDRGYEQDEALF
ncbi:MAG: dihydropteroate synthase-like protein [Halobacteriota archaeon]